MTAGLVLAAGAGRRFGGPKALARAEDGTPWVSSVVEAMAGSVDPLIVVLGAEADKAAELVPDAADVVVAEDWNLGISASLSAGLRELTNTPVDAVLVALVDQPNLPHAVIERVLDDQYGPWTLRRAVTEAGPTHPVLLGREHWPDIIARARGDKGARDVLVDKDTELVPVGDLWDGADSDYAS